MENKQPDTTMFTCYFLTEQYEWLRKKSYDTRVPMAGILRGLIQEAMEREEELQE